MLRFALIVCATVTSTSAFAAQLPQTQLGQVFPPGGQAGTTFEIRISGEQNLDYETAPRLRFSHAGIAAEPVVDPTTGFWQNNAFRVTISPDVPTGRYDVSLLGDYGASNPRSFQVDAVASQVETSDSTEDAPTALSENVAYYGRIGTATDVDNFTFDGTAGTTIVVRCDAAALDSPLQTLVEIVDPTGHRIGSAGGAFGGEAILPVKLTTTGKHRLRVTDASYRGGSNYAYRLEAATRQVVTSVWPPAGEAGTKMDYSLFGYNLPGGEPVEDSSPLVRRTVEITLPADSRSVPRASLISSYQASVDGFDFVFRDGDTAADPVPIYFTADPPEVERENDSPPGQTVDVPREIAGRFEKPGDVDHYLIEAKQGEKAYIEVFAKRYGSPADPVLTIDQVAGPDGKPKEKRIATADDEAYNIAPGVFGTASDDPTLRFVAPEDGRYRITVRDRYFSSRGDRSLFYRLSLQRPTPDFRLLIVPHTHDAAKKITSSAGINLRKGENVAVPVYLVRRDGFSGPVHVTAEELPKGLSTAGVTIGEGQTSTTLVLTASDTAATWEGPVTFIGEATLPESADGPARPTRREARVGTVVHGGPNGSTESRLAGPLVVSILEEAVPFRLDSEPGIVRIGQGSQVLVPLEVHRTDDYAESIAVATVGLPGDAKVTAEVKPFASDMSRQFARLVVDPQAPARSYTVLFNGTGKVTFTPFAHRHARAKAVQERAAQSLATSVAHLQKAIAERDAAAKSLEVAETTLQAAAEPDKPKAMAAVELARKIAADQAAAVKTAETAQKQAETAKTASDAAVAAAEKAAAPQQIDLTSPSNPLSLTIVPAPVAMTLSPANGGQVKKGENFEIKVAVKRQNGFAGPVHLSLAPPPGTGGLAAEPATIEAGADEATLRITTTVEAAEGDVPYLAIRAEADHNGAVRIDVPVTLKIVP